jgi:class 3 adenylate cyclase
MITGLRETMNQPVERRLAAILAADVTGYSRLMGEDEEGTLAALKAIRRELTDPRVQEHRGRIVKTTGDGLLVEFASVVDAVRCAVEVQRAMAERNAAVGADLPTANVPGADADRPRASTKRAVLIGMLERPDGASVAELGQRLG